MSFQFETYRRPTRIYITSCSEFWGFLKNFFKNYIQNFLLDFDQLGLIFSARLRNYGCIFLHFWKFFASKKAYLIFTKRGIFQRNLKNGEVWGHQFRGQHVHTIASFDCSFLRLQMLQISLKSIFLCKGG